MAILSRKRIVKIFYFFSSLQDDDLEIDISSSPVQFGVPAITNGLIIENVSLVSQLLRLLE